ncbi:hypothetical protein TNCV_520401 [Trichonephila clavipes]|nr:hypothetical protein TNCV_520401 [Trichonephila clavipes]
MWMAESCVKFPREHSLEGAGNAATSELTGKWGVQRADSRRGGRRSEAEKKSDESRRDPPPVVYKKDTLNTNVNLKCHLL